jgi:hypothetical protein
MTAAATTATRPRTALGRPLFHVPYRPYWRGGRTGNGADDAFRTERRNALDVT